MSDIEKLHVLFGLTKEFDVKPEHLDQLLQQVQSSDHRDAIDRFFRGYEVESAYAETFGAMPLVRLVHGLAQKQYPPGSKDVYQVPDYACVFAGTNGDCPILVDVKSVPNDKKSLKIMGRQAEGLLGYAKRLGLPILVAIFWGKYKLWTHVPLDVFDRKAKSLKITIEDALRADLSVLLGDVALVVTKPVYRKTTYGKTTEPAPVHESYGPVLSDSLSSDGKTYRAASPLSSAVFDAGLDMEVISDERVTNGVEVVERSKGQTVMKLSQWVLLHLAVFGSEPEFLYSDASRRVIVELMKQLGVTFSYSIPALASSTSATLFEAAFGGTGIWDRYQEVHGAPDLQS